MMITPLRVEGQPWEGKPLPLGLHVLHAYTHLKNGSSKVSLVVRNVSDSHIFLKKGVLVAQVVSASLVPPAELSPEMEATLGVESRPEPMSVAVRQKLLEKLNLDGLAHWSPENAAAARELVLAYHDVFVLESNELDCTSAIEHEICIENSEPFKEWFQHIPPPPLLEEVHASLRDMLEMGAICPSLSPWCNAVVLVWQKGWYSVLLCRFQMPQRMDEGFVPFAPHPGGIGKHGGVSTFLVNGFQVGLLAD